ncbi:post-GPI attachment to proteins factor 4-like [Mytilus edulis]|uniref:post-GPI attachment to proteins factor 4-like n=1 Tax=Mytilus edulis TaxID=6550 RepID=UPI0039F042DA
MKYGAARRCFNFEDKRFLTHWIFLTLLTFLIVLPIFCYRLRFSFYSLILRQSKPEGRRILTEENNERLNFSDEFIKKLQIKNKLESGVKIDVGISIISVSRNRHSFDEYEPRYLSQVVAYFLDQLQNSSKLQLTYKLFICNVDEEPSTFNEALKLSRIIPTFNRFPNTSKTQRRTITLTLEKEKEDYVYCGEQTLRQNVSYVFLVEDDALPHRDLFTVLDHLLTKQKHKMNATYVKFYHPDRLLGYISFELERIPELIGISIMMAALFVSLYQKLRPTNNINQSVLWMASIIYFVLVFLAIGRQNLIELRRISKYLYQVTPAPSCCTPANLYTRHGMRQIVDYLKSIQCYSKFGKDTAIDTFRKENKLSALMVQPNLFQHIGMYSSLRDNILNPFIV